MAAATAAASPAPGGSVRSLIDRFRNAPPMPREERMRASGGSVGGGGGGGAPAAASAGGAEAPWWHQQAAAMDQTAHTVRHEMDAMEQSFSTYAAAAGLPPAPARWAGVAANPTANP